jgi:hypothetical protein
MALYTALPIYKVAYDLSIEIFKRTDLFPREYKYTVGERLKNESLDLILQIYKANKSQKQKRLKHIAEARENVETIRLLLRLVKDLQVIGNKPFVFLNSKVEGVSVQLAGWQKYMTRVTK